jgi:hypothetical protein
MGPFGNTRKGALSFFVGNTHLPEMIEKRGHAVCGYVALGNGENEGCLLDHQAITSDESSRAAYLERENARLQRLVAELLIRNEQLRRLFLTSLTLGD